MQFLEQFFERTAARQPAAIAVDDDGATVSYGDLEARANRIAHFLIAEGIAPNDRVCIFTGKNANAYAAVLGILKSGACWVPLASNWPEERLRQLVDIIDPKFIITEDDLINQATSIRGSAQSSRPLLVLGGSISNSHESIAGEPELKVQTDGPATVDNRSPNDLAYIIFTSGSTGLPKGVMVLHRNITEFLTICHGIFGVAEGSRFAHHSDLTFDPSLFDLFYGWSRAGTIVPFNKPSYRINPAQFVRNTRANVWFSVPSAITSIVESGGLQDPAMGTIKHLVLGGEPIPGATARAWYDAFPESTIYNVYGTTETAIISHCYRIPRDFDPTKPIPVGNLLPGFRAHLMDGDVMAAPGEPGECVEYSAQLSPGYWDNESETRRHFVRDPLDFRMPQIWYRTGDLLRMRHDGLYEYAGRIDTQVKVRGHRVELGEVEAALENHEAVAEAAVVLWMPENKPNEARLIAYVAGREGATKDTLRQHLEERVPRYMIPMRFVIEPIPLARNPNGKIDRLALATRTERDEAQH